MRVRTLLAALLVLAITQMGAITCDPANGPGTIQITSPTGDVTTFSFTIGFDLVGGTFTGTPTAWLNFQPLIVSGGPTSYTASVSGGATVDPGAPLQDDNLVIVKAVRQSDGVTVTRLTPREQAEGQRAVAGTAAMKKPARGLRFTRISPPGAV